MKILIICSKKFYSNINDIKRILENRNIQVFLPNCYDKPETEENMWKLGKLSLEMYLKKKKQL